MRIIKSGYYGELRPVEIVDATSFGLVRFDRMHVIVWGRINGMWHASKCWVVYPSEESAFRELVNFLAVGKNGWRTRMEAVAFALGDMDANGGMFPPLHDIPF